jgi:hypothetical protein
VGDGAGTYSEVSGEPVEMRDAKIAWVPYAREALLRTARTYNSYITYGDLGEDVQAKSKIRTTQLNHYWVGKVLGVVSADCFRADEPLLSSLCVYQSGSVGAGFASVLDETYGGPRPDDLDLAAAAERLKCYEYFGAELPANGGRPTLTPMLAAKRGNMRTTASRARIAVEEERDICPLCHVRLPSSGQCGSHE